MENLYPATLVTVAIPTLSAGLPLQSCLNALDLQTFRSFDVVIINNGAKSLTADLSHLSFIHRVVSPGTNVGFGAAINIAYRMSSSPYLAALNDDAEPGAEWLSCLVREIQSGPLVGMCASQIEMQHTGCVDSAGMLIYFDGSSKQRGQWQALSAYSNSGDVLFPSGCAALYSRVMLEAVGVFDEDYFLYCEDTDLGLRAQWGGWKCRFVADARVAHQYSKTAGPYSLMKARLVERNRLWVALKNFPLPLLLALPFASIVRYLWQISAAYGKQGAAAQFLHSGHSWRTAALVVFQAHRDTYLALPQLMRKRAQAQKKHKLSAWQFLGLLYRHRISAKELARA